MSSPFISKLYQQHQKSNSVFPDKSLAEEFIDGFFEFLFIPERQKKLTEFELAKEFESYKSHLSTLIYDVVGNGDQTQVITNKFFDEVPEIFDGLIVVKKIVREPGERAKIAVESYDDRIDPVGACVGMKGSRIHGIVRELKNENIDVINWTSNVQLLIQRSLTPAKITSIDLDDEKKHATVYLKADQVSLAIGRRGVNIKLACELTGFEIDVFRETEEGEEEFDIDLDEFSDEIEPWIIDAFKKVGCDTGRSVLNLSPAEIERRTDLEKETIDEVLRILKEEFERE